MFIIHILFCNSVSDPCASYGNLTCSYACRLNGTSVSCFCNSGYQLATDNETCLGKILRHKCVQIISTKYKNILKFLIFLLEIKVQNRKIYMYIKIFEYDVLYTDWVISDANNSVVELSILLSIKTIFLPFFEHPSLITVKFKCILQSSVSK